MLITQQFESAQQLDTLKDRLVDVDMKSLSSTQTSRSPTTTLVLRKQDARKLDPAATSLQLHDVDHLPQDDNSTSFSSYQPLFSSYPRLRGRNLASNYLHLSSSPMYSSMSSPSRSSSALSTELIPPSLHSLPRFTPDLKPLRLSVLGRRLDPSKRLCQYEVPGGGTCRDEGCEDVHLSRLEGANSAGLVEPTDAETADYLFSIMPGSWFSTHKVHSPSRILEALQQVHHMAANDPLGLEDRVAQALMLIGSPRT